MDLDFLERIIRAAPGIQDCGVVPIRDLSGHGMVAMIVLRADFDQQRFLQFCSRSIERKHLPSKVIVVKQLPRDRSNQLDRVALLRLFEQCVSENPQDVSALLRQGAEHERAGRMAEAASCYRAAIEHNPRDFTPLHHIGRILLMQGRAQEAKHVLDEAIGHFPQSAELHTNRGLALEQLGQHSSAIASFRRAIACDNSCVAAHYNLGRVFVTLSEFEEAIPALEEAVRLAPGHVDALCALGSALAGAGRPSAAASSLKSAIGLAPNHLLANYNLGVILQDMSRSEEAQAQFERAIAIEPRYADAHRALGIALQTLGDFGSARSHIEKAIELAPRKGLFRRDLVEGASIDELTELLSGVDRLLADSELPSVDRVHLLAAAATVQMKARRPDLAFRCAMEANVLARGLFAYDESEELAIFNKVREVFTASSLAAKGNAGCPSEMPIFIVGMPRCGSTLVEQILASHPKVLGVGEADHLGESILRLGIGPFGSAAFFGSIASLRDADFAKAGANYVARLEAMGGKARVVNKTLANFLRIGLIYEMLPNARIVHVVRDAVDTCVSRFMSVFFPGNGYAHDLGELGRYHRQYELLMDYWRRVLPEGVLLDVRYEDIVAGPEPEIRKMLSHCRLEWDDSCLSFHKTRRAVSTPTRELVRQPLFSSSVGRWRQHEGQLGPLLSALERGAR